MSGCKKGLVNLHGHERSYNMCDDRSNDFTSSNNEGKNHWNGHRACLDIF